MCFEWQQAKCIGRFVANPHTSSCWDLVLDTSHTKYLNEGQVQGCVPSDWGAKLLDLSDVINQYPNQKLNTVIAGFNDHLSSIETFIEHWKFLIQLIIVKFIPNNLIVPKVIPTSCNRLVKKSLNYAFYNYIDSCA